MCLLSYKRDNVMMKGFLYILFEVETRVVLGKNQYKKRFGNSERGNDLYFLESGS